MKVKVVFACSVSVGMPVFSTSSSSGSSKVKRLISPSKEKALFGKSRLVSFNEVSKGPDDFSTSGLFVFCTLEKNGSWKYRCTILCKQ